MSKNARNGKSKSNKSLKGLTQSKISLGKDNQELFKTEKHIKIAPKHPNQGRR